MINDSSVQYLPAGDSGLIVEFGREISPELNSQVFRLLSILDKRPIKGILDLVPAYCSLYIQYDPLEISLDALTKEISARQAGAAGIKLPSPRLVEIPVKYGKEFGFDLEAVAEYHHLTLEEIISLHSGAEYTVYMIGFTPGFAYLGGLPERIATPRLSTPRTNVPAGSVGIAGAQTGIYPTDSPGGWRIIGRTDLKLFNLADNPPSLLRPGDRVKFISK